MKFQETWSESKAIHQHTDVVQGRQPQESRHLWIIHAGGKRLMNPGIWSCKWWKIWVAILRKMHVNYPALIRTQHTTRVGNSTFLWAADKWNLGCCNSVHQHHPRCQSKADYGKTNTSLVRVFSLSRDWIYTEGAKLLQRSLLGASVSSDRMPLYKYILLTH